MTDFPDWQQPQASATAISTTGVPLLRLTTSLGHATTNLPAGGGITTLVQNAAVTQPGFEAVFQLSQAAGAGTVPFAVVTLAWTDLVSGVNIASKQYFLTAGNGLSNALLYYLAGPCFGNQLTVNVQNLDPAQAQTLTWGFNQTSHLYEHDRMRQPGYANTAPVTFTNPAGAPSANVLAVTRPTISANSDALRLLAVYGGAALLSVDNGGGTATIWVALEDPGSIYTSVANARLAIVIAAGGVDSVTPVSLPYGPVQLRISNKSTTTAVTPTVSLVPVDY